MNELSVFFPAYNEEDNIEKTVLDAREVLERLNLEYEIIIINDGSVDRTGEVAARLEREHPEIRAINHPQNKGYGAALITGLYAAQKEWVAFTDADGQYNFAEIEQFINKSNIAEIVIGYRQERADPLVRKINARLFNLEMFLLFGLWVKDVDCGFKLIKKEVIETIPTLQCEGAMIEAELLIRAKKEGFSIIELPVSHRPREAGTQTGANFKVIWKGAVIEPAKLFFNLRKK